jgi:hypothetical protein
MKFRQLDTILLMDGRAIDHTVNMTFNTLSSPLVLIQPIAKQVNSITATNKQIWQIRFPVFLL